MIAVCPMCWRTVAADARVCGACGADLDVLDERTYHEKLVGALAHPDRETVMRVAGVLAARRDRAAIPALAAALSRYHAEPHVVVAIVRALGRFDDPRARDAIAGALGHESFMVRSEAALALAGVPPSSPGGRAAD